MNEENKTISKGSVKEMGLKNRDTQSHSDHKDNNNTM